MCKTNRFFDGSRYEAMGDAPNEPNSGGSRERMSRKVSRKKRWAHKGKQPLNFIEKKPCDPIWVRFPKEVE